MPEIEIRQIDILVHPGFRLIQVPNALEIPAYQKLHDAWDERVREIAQRADTVLFYLAALTKYELAMCRRDFAFPPNKFLPREQGRILSYQHQLGSRFFVHPALFSTFGELRTKELAEVASNLRIDLPSRDFVYDPNQTGVYSYGEIKSMCVETWGFTIKEIYGISDNKYQNLPDLSISVDEFNEVKRQAELKDRFDKQALHLFKRIFSATGT